MTQEVINELKKYTIGKKNTEKTEISVLALNRLIFVLEKQEIHEDWYNVPSDEITLEQARQAIKDLRKKLVEHLDQKPCNDCISRQAVLDALDKSKYSNEFCEEHHIDWSVNLGMAHIVVNKLKPVTPESKIGHWIESKGYDDRDHFYICSECGRYINLNCGAKLTDYPYCHCGAKMIEVENAD